jgi:HAD superfamily hydrolase (TIGR01509 family)
VIRAAIQAVIFDMDGLMIDSEPLHKEAWQVTLRRFGYELDEALFAQLVGLRTREDAVFLREHFRLPVMAEVLARQRNDLFLARLPGRVKPMPGLRELIAQVRVRGLRSAVATSGERRYVDAVVRELNLDGVFDAFVVAEDVERGKPAPDVYLLAAQRLGLPPAQCLALEDAPNGVLAAKAAGMRCVAVPNEMTRSLDLSAADARLPSLLAVCRDLGALIR